MPTNTTDVTSIPWDCYGWHARIDYVSRAISLEEAQSRRPLQVLDIGCGTGDLLTAPLARRHPDVSFLGVDTHDLTIEHATSRHSSIGNLRFEAVDVFEEVAEADLLVLSEVLEHVTDYRPFFERVVELVRPGGTICVTVPNGLGAAELQRRVWVRLFERTGLLDRVRKRRPRAHEAVNRSACFLTDESPHVNFFRTGQLSELCAGVGVEMSAIEGRCFLAGPFIAPILRGERLARWNESVARRLPAQLVSSWMFCATRPLDSV